MSIIYFESEPCDEVDGCKNRNQCWEPCGKLGKSEQHCVVSKHQSVWEVSNGETFSMLFSTKEKADAAVAALGATSGAIVSRKDVW